MYHNWPFYPVASGNNVAALWVGSVVGGTFAAILLPLAVIIPLILCCACSKTSQSYPVSIPTRAHYQAAPPPRTSPRSRTSPRTFPVTSSTEPVTQEPVCNQPIDPTVTEAPPPAYELRNTFSTVNETADIPPDYPEPPSYDASNSTNAESST